MEDWITQLLEHFSSGAAPYLLVMGILLLGGFGLPLPEDVPLLLGGALCAWGNAELWLMLPLVFIAVLGGDLIMFTLGRRFGQNVPGLPVIGRVIKARHMHRAERLFADHGGKTLFIARFLPGLRAAAFLVGGAARTPYWKILLYDGMAAAMSVPVFVLLGYWGANQLDVVKKWATGAQLAIIGVLVLVVVGFVIWKMKKRRKVALAD